jgi:SAM-dependent methyltransferase
LSRTGQIWEHSGGELVARLRAWWYGVDFRDLSTLPAAELERALVVAAPSVDADQPLDRLALAQRIWGPGLLLPGGTDQIMTMIKPFGVNPAMSLLDLSAGLGGASRHVSVLFDVYITGMERAPEIARRGQEMSIQAGLGRKVPISVYDPESVELRPHAFDAVYAQFLFAGVLDKERLVREIMRCLKPRGQLALYEFVQREGGPDEPRLAQLRQREPYPMLPWRAAQFADCLSNVGFDCRIAEDHTAPYREHILAGWGQLMKLVEIKELPKSHLQALQDEAELWARRLAALDAGVLGVTRFYAVSTQGAVQ